VVAQHGRITSELRRTSRFRFALLPAVAALGLVAEWEALRRTPLEIPAGGATVHLAVADFVTGLAFVGCGLLAWWQRSESRIGPLLVATAFAWFLGTFADSGVGGVASFGSYFVALHRGPLVQAVLSYPTGRLAGWIERSAVAAGYVVAVWAPLGDHPETLVALAVLVVGVAGLRFARAAGAERRARAAALAAGLGLGTVLALAAAVDLAGAGAGADRAVTWGYDAAVLAVAAGLSFDLFLRRWSEAAIAGLVIDLGDLPQEGSLRDRLAYALGDSTLVVGYWLPERSGYVDDQGQQIELPETGSGRETTRVAQGDEPVAVLVHDPAALEDPALLESVAAAAQIAVSNVRLQADIRRQVDEIEASRRRIVEAADVQRTRLARELREGPGRQLQAVGTVLEEAVREADEASAVTMLGEARVELGTALDELRELASGIHPRVLVDGGLGEGLRELARRATVPVQVAEVEERFPASIEAAAYFVCSEALANVAKYAQASRVRVELARQDRALLLDVVDDGVGGASLSAGTGLRGVADRVEALGGSLRVESPPGGGTRLSVELPLR
jgi:signal transduction histidine kinase